MGLCKDACNQIKISLNEVLSTAFDTTCGSVISVIQAIVTDGASLVASTMVALAGCVVGCWAPFIKVNLDKICNDIDIAESIVADAICLEVGPTSDAGITSGFVSEVGKKNNNSQISISGEFGFDGEIDLASSTIRIDDLLNEVQGTEELVKESADVQESLLLPTFLPPMITDNDGLKNGSLIVIYQTPENFTPSFQLSIEKMDSSDDLYRK